MRPCLALLPMLLATAPAWAAADTYRLDPVHTRVLFSIDHAGYSQAMGTVSGSEGRVRFDPDNWRDATLEVDIPVSRLDLGDAKWNQATLARSLLDGHADDFAVLLHVDGGGFTCRSHHADAVRAFGHMPIDEFSQRRVVNTTVLVHGRDEGNDAASESDGGGCHVRKKKRERIILTSVGGRPKAGACRDSGDCRA